MSFYSLNIRNLAHLRLVQQEKQRLGDMLQAAPDATLLLAEDNRVVFANTQAEQLWGVGAGGLVGLGAIELVPIEDRLSLTRYLREARVAAPQGTFRRDIVRLDGTKVATEVRVSGMALDPGLLVTSVRDVSERLRAQQEIDQQREELARLSRIATIGALSSSLTHEVSQPLAAILSNAQAGELTLDQPEPDPQLLAEIFSDIVGEAKRVREVVTNLRKMQNNERVEFSAQNVNDLLRATVRLLKNELRSQGVQLKLELADDLPTVQASEIGLQQVMLNLLTNAMDSCRDVEPVRKVITVESKRDHDRVLFSVSDQGEGIDEEVAAQVFKPFYTSKQGGLGVGLMICRRVVLEHAGRIWFERNADRGVTFFVQVPVDH